MGDDDVSTSIVEAMLKDDLEVVTEGVMTITTAVFSAKGLSSCIARLLLMVRKGNLICTTPSSMEDWAGLDRALERTPLELG